MTSGSSAPSRSARARTGSPRAARWSWPQRTRLSHRGKTVSARIALRFDEALAGAKLTADVIAVDARGARQVERGAGTIRVSA